MRIAATRERLSFLLAGHSPGSGLLRLLLSHIALSLLVCINPVLLSCAFSDSGIPVGTQDLIAAEPDSVFVEVTVSSGIGDVSVRWADVFLFSASGTRPLLFHSRFEGAGPYRMPDSDSADGIAAVVANFPYDFIVSAIKTFDNLESVSLDFRSEDPRFPVMTGVSETLSDVEVMPLMSCVEIVSVSNNSERYQRLEDPFAFLSRTNPSAELFREVGFCVTAPSADTLRTSLPCDIGLFTQYPGTRLFCYPNDQIATASNPSTVLNLCGKMEGETRTMSFPVPPIRRNTTLRCEITFDESSFSYVWLE